MIHTPGQKLCKADLHTRLANNNNHTSSSAGKGTTNLAQAGTEHIDRQTSIWASRQMCEHTRTSTPQIHHRLGAWPQPKTNQTHRQTKLYEDQLYVHTERCNKHRRGIPATGSAGSGKAGTSPPATVVGVPSSVKLQMAMTPRMRRAAASYAKAASSAESKVPSQSRQLYIAATLSAGQ